MAKPATARHLERSENGPSDEAKPHLKNLETGPSHMAKAALKNLEKPWRQRVGDAIQRCFSLAGVSQKEAAALLNLDAAQIGRWIAGTERPQFDLLFTVPLFQQPLVIALCELVGTAVELETVIRVRRSA